MNLRHSLSWPRLLIAAFALTVSAANGRAEDRVLTLGKSEQVGMSGPRLEIVKQLRSVVTPV